jgi:dihydrofolate reductase
MRKIILYIAMSLDGYIAGENESLDFLSEVQIENEDYGYGDFMKTIDTVILGRRSYDKVMNFGIPFPYSDKKTFVITRKEKPPEENITFYNGDLNQLVANLKSQNGKNIYLDGGGQIVNEFLKNRLIDEFIISIIPVVLGTGSLLFPPGFLEQKLKLVSCTSFNKGLVQLNYLPV